VATARFQRQQLIAGWDQERLKESCVAVYERDWLGAFVVWALASMGVGTILWLGRKRRSTEALANWLLADPCPCGVSKIFDYPFDAEYGPELFWTISEPPVDLLVVCTEDAVAAATCREFARRQDRNWATGATAQGGSFNQSSSFDVQPSAQDPIAAMIVAAVLVDSVRESLCPLAGSLLPPAGPLLLETLEPALAGNAVLVGVGGIGVYTATLLAALGYHLHLVDCDRVEETNLNRQGLFTATDAQENAYKAPAAERALRRLFPRASVSAEVCRVDIDFRTRLAELRPRPTVLLSAVDNAQTRLVLQELGRELGIPVIQGSTDTFAADCFTQEVVGPTLDDQMHGALTAAWGREAQRRPGGCAGVYVVPGMMAGALLAYRLGQVGSHGNLHPIRWRSGSLPIDQRNSKNGFDFNQLAI
jgi:molybdopterin/thiamine biosynthesis adenylyltransferase